MIRQTISEPLAETPEKITLTDFCRKYNLPVKQIRKLIQERKASGSILNNVVLVSPKVLRAQLQELGYLD